MREEGADPFLFERWKVDVAAAAAAAAAAAMATGPLGCWPAAAAVVATVVKTGRPHLLMVTTTAEQSAMECGCFGLCRVGTSNSK